MLDEKLLRVVRPATLLTVGTVSITHLGDVPREHLVAVPLPVSLAAALLAVVVLVGFFALVGIVLFARAALGRRRTRRRFERGAEGEREGAVLLERAGYAIEAAQAAVRYAVDVDGVLAEVALRADFVVVSRDGERFVAEVKTGRVAPRLETAATRRQLLEYQHAFDVEGVLLVDADARTVQRISFRPASACGPRSRLVPRASTLAFVAALGAIVLAASALSAVVGTR
jgi:hypothetical protein